MSSTKSINHYFIFLRVRLNLGLLFSNSASSSHSSLLRLAPELAPVLAFPRPEAAWVKVGPISVTEHSSLGNSIFQFSLYLHTVMYIIQAQAMLASQGMARRSFSLKNSYVHASTHSSSSHAGKPRRGSPIILSKELLCSRINQKNCEHILATPLGNRSFLVVAHYGMEIYNNDTIMPSIYTNPGV
jgi:hypothetical protein